MPQQVADGDDAGRLAVFQHGEMAVTADLHLVLDPSASLADHLCRRQAMKGYIPDLYGVTRDG